MDKITLYKKGGQLFYKDKSGKMCKYEGGGPVKFRKPIPNYQDSGTLGSSSPGMDNPYREEIVDRVDLENQDVASKKGLSSSQWSNIGNMVGVGLSQLNSKINPYKASDNPYIEDAFSGSRSAKKGIESGYATGQSVLSSVNPMFGAIVGVGRMGSKMIAGEDEQTGEADPARRAIANQLSPSSRHESGMKTGAEFGAGYGVLEGLFGLPIGDYMRAEKRKKAEKENQWDKDRNSMFSDSNTGLKRNDTIYARDGAMIKPTNVKNGKWNAEIEHGEIVLGDPSKMQHGGKSSTSMVSPYAAKFNGDWHGKDTDGDGQEGIPIKAQEGDYVVTNFLNMNGTPALKGEKTVAKKIEPLVKSLSKAHSSKDRYTNNKQFINNQVNKINNIVSLAEKNKQFQESLKAAKSYSQNVMQTGGKIIPRKDMEKYATDEMGVPSSIVKSAGEDNPDNYNFQNPDNYNDYEVDANYSEEVLTAPDAEMNIDDTITNTDSRQGKREDITTIDQQAGKSEYTGTSNLIQEKIREMIGEDVFNEYGRISPQWKDKLKSEYGVSQSEVDNATMQNITQGSVGKVFGKMLEQAYGVLGKGRDETLNQVDVNVSGKTNRPRVNNKLNWAQDVIDNIKANDGVVPSEYNNLPEDLKDELTNLARSNKTASQGRFGTSLNDAYRLASTADTEEIDRQKSYTYEDEEVSGAKIDKNYDLGQNGIDGKKLSFNEAFRYARQNDLPEFKWNGKSYAARTASEDPELAKTSVSRAISNTKTNQPSNNLNITPQEMNKNVTNPKRTLNQLKYGGMLNRYQKEGMIEPIVQTQVGNQYADIAQRNLYNNAGNMANRTAAENWDYNKKLQDQLSLQLRQAEFDKMLESRNPNRINIVDKYNPYSKINSGKPNSFYTTKQMGGEMEQPMPNESHEAMMQLAGQDPNAQEQMDPNAGQEMVNQEQGQVPVQIAELDPQLQQMFMGLTPEQQQQILALPPEQIEIALQALMQQMSQGPQQQAPQMDPGMSEVPQGVQDQFAGM